MDRTGRGPEAFDKTDLDLLAYIENDFDVNLGVLSEELDLSKSAVHYRLNKLRERGVIEGVTADLDPLAFGLSMVVITDVRVTHEEGYADEIGERLADVAGVEQVYYTMGDVDFVVISRVQSREQMNDLIDDVVGIDGVDETSSTFVMRELKRGQSVLANAPEEALRALSEEE